MNKIIFLTLIIFCQLANAVTMHPKTVAELKETSVRIMNVEMTSGGTGSIYKSTDDFTEILTNKHICRLIEPGGIVDYKGKQYDVVSYKKFPDHDLCLLKIGTNLGINLEAAKQIEPISSKSVVSGHPSLLPHIATIGHLSEKQDIQLVNGVKPCHKADFEKNPLQCIFLGGIPVIVTLKAQLVSNLIKPGNSGSAVFNKDGYLIGVVFAGDGKAFSFGFIVPQENLVYFLQSQYLFPWVDVGTPVDDGGVDDRVFNYEKCVQLQYNINPKLKPIKDFCKTINDNLIWRK